MGSTDLIAVMAAATEPLGGLPWKDIGATTIVVMVVLMILTGRIIPRSAYNDVKEQRDMFKTAWEESQQLNRDYDERLDANTDALRTVVTAINAIVEGDRRRWDG